MCVHGLMDETVTFDPGAATVGDAVNVRRLGGRRVVDVVLDGRDVLVAACVVDVAACVVAVVGAVVVWARAATFNVSVIAAPTMTPSTNT